MSCDHGRLVGAAGAHSNTRPFRRRSGLVLEFVVGIVTARSRRWTSEPSRSRVVAWEARARHEKLERALLVGERAK
jgi:hypothetical protein